MHNRGGTRPKRLGTKARARTPAVLLTLSLGLYGCSTAAPAVTPTIPSQPDLSAWESLQQASPQAHTTPLPDPVVTAVDGIYALYDASAPQYWSCRRCADYRPTGGVWRLQLDRGVMRLYYAVSEWRNVASYALEGDRLTLFNDGICPQVVGEYGWDLEGGSLQLRLIDDACAFGLRAENLTRTPWRLCPAGGSAEQPTEEPAGCEDTPAPAGGTIPEGLPVSVDVSGGDARYGPDPPDRTAHANPLEISPSEGLTLSHHPGSIGFGVTRVLWGEGMWLEAATELPAESFGVQLLGDHVIGWALVLFDGQEVWRGDAAQIWSRFGRFGGYIEVSGFGPGRHTLRVESLGVDGRPAVVSFFGLHLAGEQPAD